MLAGTLPAFEMFMSRWEILAEKHQWLKPFIDIGLSWARKYYCKMDQTRAYVVAMGELLCLLGCFIFTSRAVLNPSVRMSWIRRHWEPHFIEQAEKTLKDLVCSFSDDLAY